MRTCSVAGCGRPTKHKQYCPMHYMRAKRYPPDQIASPPLNMRSLRNPADFDGTVIAPFLLELQVANFWARVSIAGPEECWEWVGKTWANGYGRVKIFGKAIPAHRLAYIVTHGDTDADCICHRCDNTRCCNPAHFFAGSHRENSDDKVRKGRHVQGSASPWSKLTETQVLAIRHRLASGETINALAAEHRVSPTIISTIKTGRRWQHVGGPIAPRSRPGPRASSQRAAR